MPLAPLPPDRDLTVCFAHVAYRLGDAYARARPQRRYLEARSVEELAVHAAQADVIVASGLWRNPLLETAPRLRFVQSVSAGMDNFDAAAFKARGVRLASARGVNARAVAEHAMALILALSRRIPEARDNQAKCFWRGMIGDPTAREDELSGKTLLIVGLGGIGQRLASLAKAFDMRVIATRRDPSAGAGAADAIYADDRLAALVAEADIVALTCPLTAATTGLISADVLARMKPTAHLVNVARGRVVDEPALISALERGRLAAAALDVTVEEPLPAASPLWAMPNVLITPHTAGETQRYEAGIVALLLENLAHLRSGAPLRNAVA